MANWKDISPLGAGLGAREPLVDQLLFEPEGVDFLEILGDHYLQCPPAKLSELTDLTNNYTVIPHFIGLCLGSATGLNEGYLDQVAALLEKIKPPYWSEHIAFTEAHGLEIGHLTPVPYTQEALDAFARNIETVKAVTDTPLILENITYPFPDPVGKMREGEFIHTLLEQSDCGHLLDLTNLHCNHTNHGIEIEQFLDDLDLSRVIQFHFVGVQERQGVMIDNHSAPTQEAIWQLMEKVAPRCPNLKGAILERDGAIPTLADLKPELDRARKVITTS